MPTNSTEINLDMKATEFELLSTEGKKITYASASKKNGLAVAFICNHCPYVKDIINRLVTDFSNLSKLEVGAIAIMSNDVKKYPEDSFQNMIDFAEQHKFKFPYLYDEDQKVATSYQAVCTPDFFCFNKEKKLFYRGRLDNIGYKKNTLNRVPELLNAFQRMIESNEQTKVQHNSMGCSIKWK